MMSSNEFSILVTGSNSSYSVVDSNDRKLVINVNDCDNVQIGDSNTLNYSTSKDSLAREDEMQSVSSSVSSVFSNQKPARVCKSTENMSLPDQFFQSPESFQQAHVENSSLPMFDNSPRYLATRSQGADDKCETGNASPVHIAELPKQCSCRTNGSSETLPSQTTSDERNSSILAMSSGSISNDSRISVTSIPSVSDFDNSSKSLLRNLSGSSMVGELLQLSPNCDVNTLDLFEEPLELAPFIGRQRERETIKHALNYRGRLIQIQGPMMVGKRRLAQQAIQELIAEDQNKPRITRHIPCKNLISWTEFLEMFSQRCDLEIKEYVKHCGVFSKFREKFNNESLILLFSNCEIFLSKNFSEQNVFEQSILYLLECCPSIQIVLTTQTSYNMDNRSQDLEIKRLDDVESFTLFQRSIRNIDALTYQDAVIERCYGLPPLILDAASLVKKNDSIFPITPEDLKQLLDDDVRWKRIHRQTVSGISDFFPGLTEYLQQRIADLSIFRASFSLESLKDILPPGRFNENILYDINELYKSSVVALVKEHEQVRLKVDPFVDAMLKTVLRDHVKCNDVTRLKYVSFFGKVLTRANSELFISSQETVYGYLQPDWLNLEQVLKQAIHCTGDTFQVFMQVAIDADDLLIRCFPSEALNFYKVIECSATKFGSSLECATLRAKLGRALTEIKETSDNLDKASLLFEKAEDVLVDSGPSCTLVAFYRDMSFNKFKRSLYQESFEYCHKALNTASEMDIDNSVTNHIISIRARLAIILNVLRDFKEAEILLFETLELAHIHTPYHPAIYKMLNSLGNNYEYSGQDNELALKYYRASLFERRKFEAMVPGDLVVALNNVGRQYAKQGKYDQGLQYLNEAYKICRKVEKENFNVGFTMFNMGSFHFAMGRIGQAVELLQQAIQNYKLCAIIGGENIIVRLTLSHCFIVKDDSKKARKCLQECLDYKQYFVERTHPPIDNYLLVLGHLIVFYRDDRKHLLDYLIEFIEEASRLLDLKLSTSDKDNIEDIHKLTCNYLDNVDTSRIHDIQERFRHKLLNMCIFCNQLQNCGYTCDELWIRASRIAATEVGFKNRLLNSPALNAATNRLKNKGQKQLTSDLHNVAPGMKDSKQLKDTLNLTSILNGNHDIRRTSKEFQFCGNGAFQFCRDKLVSGPNNNYERVATESTFPPESALSKGSLSKKRHDNCAIEDLI
ncbi:hypothetical protein LOTGIDRAFT_235440 [Lottia gigantea]|uniref:Uncharacterized protein n=1 Tax=Lottia gigantea TaxID=225164 RepID=V4BDB0_LOTGI|nr:hypothetical protein LOTGIDRAFT_235440 [Lottia gigantea]ESO86384.1 hypothetical protein LOTGIDRAFT_235440 [Lottia gigantea]